MFFVLFSYIFLRVLRGHFKSTFWWILKWTSVKCPPQKISKCKLFLKEGSTALSGIYLIVFTMQQVLRSKCCWTTLGHKILQKNCTVNIFNFLKSNNIKSMEANFFLFFFLFILSLGLFHIQNLISNFWMSIS